MKIIHFSDVHIGMENYGTIDSRTGYNTRFLDFLNSFDQLIKKAKKINPDLILFTGDAYKDRFPSPTHQKEFAGRIKKLALIAPTVLIVGNHDLPQALEKANTLDIFSALEVNNVFVSRNPEILSIKTKSGKIQVLTLPWLTKGKLLEKNQYTNKSQEKIQKLLTKQIELKVKKLIKKLDPSIPTIVGAHITSQKAVFSSERAVMIGQDLMIDETIFNNPKIKYVALGHIHKYQVLRKNPPVVYSGSIDRIDFGEEKDEKGFVLVEFNGKTIYQFIPLHTRKFITIKLNLITLDNIKSEIKNKIKKYKIKDAVIRVKVKTSKESADQLTDSEIRKNLSQAHYISSISYETPETKKIREIKYFDQSSSPLDILDEYLKHRKVSSKRIKILQNYTHKLLEEIE